MSNWSKSVIYGGIYPKNQSQIDYPKSKTKLALKYPENILFLEETLKKSKKLYLSAKTKLKNHISHKQEIYWPVLIAIILMLFVFASRIASAKATGAPNNLPIKDHSKLNLISFGRTKSGKIYLADSQSNIQTFSPADSTSQNKDADDEKEALKEDITKIVKNTPMAAMIDSISQKDRLVAAFLVGIAMKESKFGVYSPKLGGRDCYNYWGFKGGGKTVAGGYTCFSSPENAVDAVAHRLEKMIAKGVRNPAQAISWKCGSSCTGHGAENVRKWISDVGVNFYKIKS